MNSTSSIASSPVREPLLSRQFVLAFVSHFLHGMSLNLYLHLPGFLKEAGAGEGAIGFLFSATAATSIVARPFMGRSMDLWGRRPMILAGGVLSTIVCFLYLTVHGLGPWMLALRIGHGVGEAMLLAALFAFAADIVPASRRIEGVALFGISSIVPLVLSSLLGDAVLARAGYDAVFLLSVALSGAALLASLPLSEPRRANAEEPPRGLLTAFLQRDLLPLWFIGVVFSAAVNLPSIFMKTFVMTTGVGSVSAFFSADVAAVIALRLGLGSLPERVGPKRVLIPALALQAVGVLLLAFATSSSWVVASGLFAGIGHGYVFPILLGLVVARARPSERGAALSTLTALLDAGILLSAPLFGTIIQTAGYPVMFEVAAGTILTGTVVFAVWDSAAPKTPG